MNEDEVVQIVRTYIEGLFPKVCSTCGRRFASLRDYLENTTHLESPIVYDDISERIPVDALGPMSYADCTCGTTLTISSRAMPQDQLLKLMTWARDESLRRSIGIRDLLDRIRERIDQQVLQSDHDQTGSGA